MTTGLFCRYTWIKRHLLEFEEKLGSMFPINWEVSERITIQFCYNTRDELSKIMAKRKNEIDVNLLLHAIKKTTNFESLLARRFTGITLEENDKNINKKEVKKLDEKVTGNDGDPLKGSPFHSIIGQCFIPYLNIYIDSVDRNLADLIER